MLKVLELFGGIGACSKALERIELDFKVVDYVEIDKYAVKSYNAINNTNFEPQDIMTYDKDLEVDLIMHGSPCQDFSLAGKQAGGDKDSGTRSSLMFETLRIVEKLKPTYVIWENVKNVISKRHKHNFDEYLKYLESLGYTNYWQVLNAKDYVIPQNRERVFVVSIIGEHKPFEFPPKQELKLKLKDMLEDEVDEKYYLTTEKIHKISHWKAYQKPFEKVQGNKSIVPTLTARGAGEEHSGMITYSENLENTTNLQEECLHIKNNTKKGYKEAHEGDGINLEYLNSQKRRGRVGNKVSQTLTTSCNQGVVEKKIKYKDTKCGEVEPCDFRYDEGIRTRKDLTIIPCLTCKVGTSGVSSQPLLKIKEAPDIGVAVNNQNTLRIRKLTPKECWRLMGFDDSDFEKAQKVNSTTQLYKQAGNSIVVNVLEKIFKNLLKGE